jgi:Arc/MetJ-type ribon-helix-helix transcriptional regulator
VSTKCQCLDRRLSRAVGELCAHSTSGDVIDAHVAMLARDRDIVLTSDAGGLQGLLRMTGSTATARRRWETRRLGRLRYPGPGVWARSSCASPCRRMPRRSTKCSLLCMTTPVPTRFSDQEIALIDELVSQGIAESRSAVIRRAVVELAEAVRRARTGAAISESYRLRPQTIEDDELAMANAIALTEAEPW